MAKEWFKATGIRMIKTMAEAAVAMIGLGVVLTDIDWLYVGSATLLSGILCALTCIVSLPEVKE